MAPNDPKNGGGFFASPLCPDQLTVWLAMRDWILLIPKEVQRIQQRKQTEEDGSKRYICFYREKWQHKKKRQKLIKLRRIALSMSKFPPTNAPAASLLDSAQQSGKSQSGNEI